MPELLKLPESPSSTLDRIRAEIRRRKIAEDQAIVARDAERIRSRCITLSGFVREAWHVLEPNNPLLWSWHLDAICDHLQAITDGRINRLLINVPPGSSKSMLVSVMWQAWEWGPAGLPSNRFLTTAFNDKPITRDTRKCRDLIESEWYQRLWPEVEMTRRGETSFANSSTGTREGVAFGSLTSQRGDRLVIDDPHSTETAESDADRVRTTRKFRESAIFRLNDPERSAIVVVMQRLHEDDVSGIILKQRMPFVHLMLPMEFEPERDCTTKIGFEDPRSYDGELLDTTRFSRPVVEQMKRDTTEYAWAGQYQQRPAPREGGMFKLAWFSGKILNQVPPGTKFWRHWDLAATKRTTAPRTAGVKMGRAPDGKIIVADVKKFQEEGTEVRKSIRATAELDGTEVSISLPQDPGQAGKVQKADFANLLIGFTVKIDPETGDKEHRAMPFAAQCELGNVYLVRGDWNEEYVAELCSFPSGSFKDQVDASSGAFGRLILKKPNYAQSGSYQIGG